jgi:molybdopterin/thiamine biosynthesis adenylyltransferase
MMADLSQALFNASYQGSHPRTDPRRLIKDREIERIAEEFGISRNEAEIAALEAEIVPARYVRNMAALDCKDQISLLKSRVVIIGLGGLGGYVAQTLARSGVGSLVLVDGDVFEQTNLNRQAFSTIRTLGENKAEAALEKIRKMNPSVNLEWEGVFLDKDNAGPILKGADVIMDCLGGLDNRALLQQAAHDLEIPLVSAALAGFTGHVTVVFPGDQGLFSGMGPDGNSSGEGVETDLGCPCPPVMLAASIQCSEAIKVLTNKGKPLQNKLLAFDLQDNTFQVFDLS